MAYQRTTGCTTTIAAPHDGPLHHHNTADGDGSHHRRAKQVYLTVARPDDERIDLGHGIYPAIVTCETAMAAHEAIKRNKVQSRRNNKSPETFLLRAGFIYCGHCGKAISTIWKGEGDKERPVYKMRRSRWEHTECEHRSINAAKADAIVWEHIIVALSDDDEIARRVRAADEADPYTMQLDRLARQIDKLTMEKDRARRDLDHLHESLRDEGLNRLNAKAAQLAAATEERAAIVEAQAMWRSERQAGPTSQSAWPRFAPR